jgi:hypothetical protein
LATIVSRRRWDDYLIQTPPKLKASAQALKNGGGAKADDKPWPRYLVWTGYGLAATLIPYMAVWIGLTNEGSREYILEKCGGPRGAALVRRHFGHPEISAVSYVDRTANSNALPHALLGEEDFGVREQQTHIANDCWKGDVKVRVHVVSNHTNVEDDGTGVEQTTEVTMPAAVLSSPEDILSQAAWRNHPSVVASSSPPQDAVVSVDFVSQPPPSRLLLKEATLAGDEDMTMSHDGDAFATPPPADAVDALRRTAPVYSLWHYQPTVASTGAPAAADQELQVERLRAGIERLQDELQNSAAATSRPIDDIVDELQLHKAELRRLNWKKWKPW